MSSTHLHFNMQIGRQKPESIRNRSTACPFCDRDNLENILASDGSIILLKNKYPVLENTLQTVLIETDECDSELSTYSKEHLYRLIRFGVENWEHMEQSGDFTSVLFFKNHGPYSGGTIHHPHMQIVGLKHIDYHQHVQESHFEGIEIDQQPGVDFNISTMPRIGFFEFNVMLHDPEQIDRMADYIQTATHYTLNHFNKNCTSYNLFFYRLSGGIACKIVPRFVTSPLFVGYSIPQVSNRIEDVAQEMKAIYFQEEPSANENTAL
jgi:galactose-1-phosphate uridylyltransferase